MNSGKEFNLSQLKMKIKWSITFIIFGLLLVLSSCSKKCDVENIDLEDEEYPFLKVLNRTNDSNSRSITSVTFVGYEFNSLSITESDSQTFNLDSGMPAGYDDINIIVRISGPQIVVRNIKVNFNIGATTTIYMKGCISSEGCEGFYLE